VNKHSSFHTHYLLLCKKAPPPRCLFACHQKIMGRGYLRKRVPRYMPEEGSKENAWETVQSGRRKKMSRSGRWPMIRRQVWDRDRKAKAPCHICGGSIDYSLRPSSCPDSWEPDHIIPVSKRPDLELDMSNIKASHMRCNRARGDGTNGENDLGMQSRIW